MAPLLFSPNERTSPPFAWFFLFASLDAAAGVGALLLYFVSGIDMIGGATDSLFAWHGRELVFGYAPGVCTGFLLTALPRWTKRTPGPVSENRVRPLWRFLPRSGATIGLAVWVVHPTGAPMTLAGLFAAATQLGRLAQWRGWTVIRVPAVLIFHLAYAFVPAGFALFALDASLPHLAPASAALHAWTVGGMGLMTLAIMGSMIRRHTGRPFLTSRLGTCVFALAIVAATTRIAAEFAVQAKPWLIIAAACWILAFLLFVLDFRLPLLHRIGLRRRSWRGTTPRQESADRLS
jgi:uncharacterized protein involved in response to NO